MDNEQSIKELFETIGKLAESGKKQGDLDNSSKNKKKLNKGVKECKLDTSGYKERTLLKRYIFIEKGLSYSSVRKLLREKENIETTRQYLYGICSGRLNPSFEFAKKLCRVLGIDNVYLFFDQNELYLPDFEINGGRDINGDK